MTYSALRHQPHRPDTTQLRVMRSELIKIRSVRSTVISLGLAMVVVVAVGMLVSALLSDEMHSSVGSSLSGLWFAQLVLGVLGATLVTTEYSSGMMRTTLTAVPVRRRILWAKAAALGTVSFLLLAGAVMAAFLGGQAVYGGEGDPTPLSDPGVFRALVGAAFYPAAVAVMGVALGVIVRRTGAAVGILLGVLFVVPSVIGGMPGVLGDIALYLPSFAGEATMSLANQPGFELLSPAMGFVVTAGWMAVLLAAAAGLLDRRDA